MSILFKKEQFQVKLKFQSTECSVILSQISEQQVFIDRQYMGFSI